MSDPTSETRSLSTRFKAGSMAEVLAMASTTVVTMSSYALMGFIGAIMVGRLGTAALAGVGLSATFYNCLLSLFLDAVAIVNAFSSQAFGAKQYEESARRCWQGIYIGVFSSLALLAVAPFYGDVLRLFGSSPEVQAIGRDYGVIRLWGTAPLLVYVAIANFLRGVGMIRAPMLIAVVTNVVNIGLGYALIFGKFGLPAMGYRGAAWSINLAQTLGCLLMFAVFFSRRLRIKFNTVGARRFLPRMVGRMLRVGLPAGAQTFGDVSAFTIFFAFVGRMGDVELAASQAGFQIVVLALNVNWGVAMATTTLVGQYLGAKRADLAERSARMAARLVLGSLLLVAAAMVVFPARVVGWFTTDAAVLAGGVLVVYLCCPPLVFGGLGQIAVGALRGAGDTRWAMVVALLGAWGIFLPVSYLFGETLGGGVPGAWLGYVCYGLVVSNLYMSRFRGGKWKSRFL